MSWAGKKSIKHFLRSLFKSEQAPSSSVRPLTEIQRTRIEQKLEEWVQARGYYVSDRSITESAQRIGCNSLLLYRYFALQGLDFRSWRSRLRIQDAQQQMIAFPEDSVSAIARRVGIPDRSNFNRQFKALVGQTPDSWRKMQK